MNNKPLTKKEFKKLNRLLSKQCNIDLNFVDGVITSAISSPELIKPSQYMSLFCNENEGLKFDEEEQVMEFYELLFRHHNSIIHDINTSSTYKILAKFDDKEFSLSQWCKEYLLCLDLYHSSVTEKLPDVSDDVETIEKYSASNENIYDDKTIPQIRKQLSSIVTNLYDEFRSINSELSYEDINEYYSPLTTEELNFVTKILTQYQTKDSIQNIYELDGFVVGTLSHFIEFDADEIIDSIWNYSDEQPNWSIDEEELFIALFEKWTNYHAQQLIEYPDEYQPLYLTAETDKQFECLQSWCRGYLRGITIFEDYEFESFDPSMMEILKLLVLLTGDIEDSQEFLAMLKPKDKLELILKIKNIASLIFCNMANLIEDENTPPFFDKPEPSAHAPKIGRNDPCFCGSGKKYKKCCLH